MQRCVRSLTINRVISDEGESIQFSDSIMDFSIEELGVIIHALHVLNNQSMVHRMHLMEQYNAFNFNYIP